MKPELWKEADTYPERKSMSEREYNSGKQVLMKEIEIEIE